MSFNVFQQVFYLSLASNLVNDVEGTLESLQSALQDRLASALPKIGTDWKVVWGPVVWKFKDNDSTGPDNSWYIAYNPCLAFEDGSVHPTYVIAIAGTPRESLYAWFAENFTVNMVSDFKNWVAGGIQNRPAPAMNIAPGGAYIAKGTADTVHLLLTTPAPEGTASASTTLLDFVTNLDLSESPRFIFTGHSLGGTLSPSLALALVVSDSPIRADSTLTYPTAGASPGNIGLTDLFEETFPPLKSPGAASYQGWNLNLVNKLDPVPQAWCAVRSISPEQNLFNIPTMYGEPALAEVRNTIFLAAIWSRISGVLYKPLPSQYFTGDTPTVTPDTLTKFLQIVDVQHLESYLFETKVPIPSLDESQPLGVGLAEKTTGQKRFNHPLIIDFEWELENPGRAKEIVEQVQGKTEAQAYLGEVEKESVSV